VGLYESVHSAYSPQHDQNGRDVDVGFVAAEATSATEEDFAGGQLRIERRAAILLVRHGSSQSTLAVQLFLDGDMVMAVPARRRASASHRRALNDVSRRMTRRAGPALNVPAATDHHQLLPSGWVASCCVPVRMSRRRHWCAPRAGENRGQPDGAGEVWAGPFVEVGSRCV